MRDVFQRLCVCGGCDRRIATVQTESVIAKINRLNCPTKQKLELVDAVIDTVKRKQKEQVR